MRRPAVAASVVLILLIATGLRFHRLEVQSFWNDEGNSARLSERPIPLILEGTASDIHPPLYYLLLHGWRELAGATEFGLRSLSAYAGILTVAATMALGRRGGWGTALIAGALVATAPPLVYYSQEARMYSLLALLAVLSTLLLLRWLKQQSVAHAVSSRLLASEDANSSINVGRFGKSPARQPAEREAVAASLRADNDIYQIALHLSLLPSARPQTRPSAAHASSLSLALGYILAIAAGLYTHYFFPAIFPFHFLMLFLGYRLGNTAAFVRLVAGWLGLVLGALLLYVPWLPIFIRQTGGRPIGASLPDALQFLPAAARWLTLGPCPLPPAPCSLPIAPLLATGVLLMLALARRWSLLLALGVLLFILFMMAGGLTHPAFYKFLVVAVPSLWLLAASGWRGRLRLLALPLLLLILWGHGNALAHLYFDPAYARANYRAMAARIDSGGEADTGILLNAANQWEVFTYYYDGPAPVYPIPRGFPDPARIESELEAIAGRHDQLYALFWGEAERDPQRLVERWLDSHAFKAGDEWYGDVRFVTYAVPDEPSGVMETFLGLSFGDAITLEGFTLTESELAPGEIVQLTLFWQARQPIEKRYKVFLHLVDAQGQLVAQRDGEPGGGLALTTTWPPGETIADNHGILVPLNTPPGAYRLLLGLYEPGAPAERLPITSAEDNSDAYVLAEITVTPVP